jgi:hypothetical protein
MLKRAIIAVAVLAIAAPGLAAAKGKRVADDAADANAGPVPYSQLAEADAKLNGPAPKAHHHAKKKVSKDASQAGTAEAGKTAK